MRLIARNSDEKQHQPRRELMHFVQSTESTQNTLFFVWEFGGKTDF